MKKLIKKFVEKYLPKKVSKEILASYRLLAFRVRKQLVDIEFQLVEHCNLNCAGCDHFSSIAAEEYADLHSVEKDMERLSLLTHGNVRKITLIGGEPLLHKDVTAFFPIVRRNFPKSNIFLFTNGILLPKQPDTFWEACRDNNIVLFVTRYPIKIDVETIESKCKQYGLEFLRPPGIRDEEMYRCVLSLEGKGNVKKNWKYCIHNYWAFLRNGRIYPCPFYANIQHFNQYFNKTIPITENDTIDIHKAKNLREILRFLAKPIPGCKYCDIGAYTYGHKWGISKKDIGEWT
jgi:MoaA/NifB/PqqE/SkfB family radical SAM enzyme